MKKNILLFLYISIFHSCKNDLEIAANGPEFPILYAILNQSDSVQYVKINKAFLDKNSSAFTTAQIKDSLYFPENISVFLIDNNAGSISSITLDTISLPKENGIFAGPNQLFYLIPKNKSIQETHTYTIEVRRLENNKLICSAQTGIVGNISIERPGTSFGDTSLPFLIFFRSNNYFKTITQWTHASKANLYDGLVRFYYDEIDTVSGDSIRKFVEWNYFKNLEPGNQSTLAKELEGEVFYKYLSTQIKENPRVKRYGLPVMDFEIYAAGEDLSNYIRISGPSYFISDIKPVYTNVKGGYGIVSTRNYKKIKIQTDLPSLYRLETDTYTGNLGFKHRN